jgi:S-DNA-T family DNA segregation ATPase FtsK/SpoIIIE
LAARRTRKNTKKNKERIRCEVIGIGLIALSVLVLLGLQKGGTGVFGSMFRDYVFGLFGIGGYGIPLFIMLTGVIYIMRINIRDMENKAIALFLLYFSILILIHIISGHGQLVAVRQNLSLWENLKENAQIAFLNGMEKRGGGIVGGVCAVLLYKVFGSVGSKILATAIALISAVILTDRSIVSLLIKLCKGVLKIAKNSAVALKEFIMVPEEQQEEIEISTITDADKRNDNTEPERKQEDRIKIFDSKDVLKGINESAAAGQAAAAQIEELELHKTSFTNEFIGYRLPPVSLLSEYESKAGGNRKELLNNARKLEDTLNTFGVVAKVVQVSVGPAITRYELHPSPGVKVSRILNLSDDIALSMAATSVRIEAPIPGKSAIGLEIPNKETVPVTLRELIESVPFKNSGSKITVALGKDIAGNPVVIDLSGMPHLLIAGATGSGKSVCINGIITSLLYKASPAHVKLILIDPKMVELSHYNGIPHLLAPVVTEPRKATGVLNWVVQEMTNRYKEFAQIGVKDIHRYNQVKQIENSDEYLPQIVVIIDELSDLMMVSPAEVEDAICRIAQMARASGIHLVIATQRPSVDVITGIIKANIPSRISFAVSSQVDSRTILDMAGAEKLMGRGDMLYHPTGEYKPVRVQGALVEEEEIEKIVAYVREQVDTQYSEEVLEAAQPKETSHDDCDELLPDAIEIVLEYQQASASLLQRKLKVGYARAARMVDQMEERGIIGPFEGSKPRRLLVSRETINQTIKGDS